MQKAGKASEVLASVEVPKPVPKADEVLVKAAATSINPIGERR